MASGDVKHHVYLLYCVTKSGRVWRKVPESDARSVYQPFCKKKKTKKKRYLGVCLPAASRLSRVKPSDGPQTSIRSTNTSLAAVLGGKFLTDGLKERWLKQTGRRGEKRGPGFRNEALGLLGRWLR